MQDQHRTQLPDIDFRHLRTFVALAQVGNFSAAGRTLGLSQSAVSRQIGALEMAFSMRLFDRLGRRARLTFAGNALRARLERLMREAESLPRALADLREGVQGELRIGASTTLANTVVPPLLSTYRRKFPQVRLALENSTAPRLFESLERGAIDIAFTATEALPSAITVVAELPDELVLIASQSHPLAKKRIAIEELRNCDFIQRDSGSHTRQLVELWFQAERVQPRTAMEVG
jgi:DNA-binding transcriptional LysR family regulator